MDYRLAIALFALVAALLVAGCGGDDDAGTDTGASAPANGAANGDGSPGADSAGAGGGAGTRDGAGSRQGADEGTDGGDGRGGDGGAEQDGSAPGGGRIETASRADFVKRADAICRSSGKRLRAEAIASLPSDGIDRASKDEIEATMTEVVAPALEAQVDRLRTLEPPPGDEGKVEDVLAAIEGDVQWVRENPSQFQISGNPFAESRDLARQYGLEVCGGYF